MFDYGIDVIRQNLQFIKDFSKNTKYAVGDSPLSVSKEEAIAIVEIEGREQELRDQVIDLWEAIEKKFDTHRKPKVR